MPCAVVLGAPAEAERVVERPVLGSLIPDRRPPDYDAETAMSVGREMAACLVRKSGSVARDFVLVHGREKAPATYKQVDVTLSYCINATASYDVRKMQFGNHELRGLVAEALLRRKMPSLSASAATPGQYAADWISENPASAALDRTAICVAQTQPDVAERLIVSDPGTPAETASFAQVAPALRLCVAADAAFRASKVGIRLALASAVFHRAYDNAEPTAAAMAGKN